MPLTRKLRKSGGSLAVTIPAAPPSRVSVNEGVLSPCRGFNVLHGRIEFHGKDLDSECTEENVSLRSIGNSIGDSVGEGISLLVTIVVIFAAFLVFVVTSTADDAIWNGLGQPFRAMGRDDLRLAWDILGFALGLLQ